MQFGRSAHVTSVFTRAPPYPRSLANFRFKPAKPMRTSRHNFLQVVSVLALFSARAHAQQGMPLAAAEEGPTLAATAGANDNRSAVVFNPDAGLYYSVDAGCRRYPVDTYSESGAFLGTTEQGFDYRGAWWNPATHQLEGNGYLDAGLFAQTLSPASQLPTGTGTVLLKAAQPDAHSVGAFDPEAKEIIYYHDGSVSRYSRSNNSRRAVRHIKELPTGLGDLNANSIVYTGFAGHEWGVYDHAHRRLLFINKRTGTYSGFCQLPPSAPARTLFGMSYANGYFWLFDAPDNPGMWRSYRVFPPAIDPEIPAVTQAVTETASHDELIAQAVTAVEQLMAELALAAEVEALSAVEPSSAPLVAEVPDVAASVSLRSVEEAGADVVNIYPVPANEWLRVELSAGSALKSARVLDLAGRVVPAPATRTSEHGLQLNVGALPTGSYALEALNTTGAVRRTFMVVH